MADATAYTHGQPDRGITAASLASCERLINTWVAGNGEHGIATCLLDDLRGILASVCADFEAELVEFDGEDDHVHLLVNYPPKVAVSALVNSLKGVSSRMIRKKNYPSIRKKLWGGALWSPSYFAGSCGGAPLEVIRQYIEQQQTPH